MPKNPSMLDSNIENRTPGEKSLPKKVMMVQQNINLEIEWFVGKSLCNRMCGCVCIRWSKGDGTGKP